EGPDRARNIRDLMLAQIGKSDRQLVAHLIAHRTADVDATRFGKALQLRSHGNAVAIDRLTIAQHIAAIDADAKPDLALLQQIGARFYLHSPAGRSAAPLDSEYRLR